MTSPALTRYPLDMLSGLTTVHSRTPTSSNPAPPVVFTADAAQIIDRCPFMQHCRNDASTLSEPEWHAMISILALCSDSDKLIHELSSAYPNYSFDETQEKINRARAAEAPVTCEYIKEELGFTGCRPCPVKSPIGWVTSTLGQATDHVESFITRLKEDSTLHTDSLPEQTLSALATISLSDSNLYRNLIRQIQALRPKLKPKEYQAQITELVQEEDRLRDERKNASMRESLSEELGFSISIPSGYAFSEKGIERVSRDKRTNILPRLALPCKRYLYPGNELIEVKYQRGDRFLRTLVERSALASTHKTVEQLASHGVPVDSTTVSAVVPFFTQWLLANDDNIPKIEATPSLGWQEDGSFIPSLSSMRLIKPGDAVDSTDSLLPRGTLDEWVSLMRPLRESIGARLAMAASMAAPLLHHLNIRTFLVHLWGPSRGGKTACQKAALSLFLNPATNMVSFNATRVGLEVTLSYLRHLPFMINERQQAGGDQGFLDQLVYMFGEGQGRTRGARHGGLRSTGAWQTVIITSGEHPLTSDSSAEGTKTRTLEINANKFIEDDALASTMHTASETCYGTAGIAVLKEFLANEADIRQEYEGLRETTKAEHSDLLGSYHSYIAVLAVAERLLSQVLYGHTEDEAKQHSLELINHIVSSITPPKEEYELAKEFLQGWIAEHPDKFAPDVPTRAGWIEHNDVYFIPTAFNSVLTTGGFHPARVRRDFVQNEIISRGRNEITITRTNPVTGCMTRVLYLRNFLFVPRSD